jgi:multicomponent Na+:H+ antiporter subunit C
MTQVVLAVALGALATVGTYLLLRRDVVRVVWGVAILGQTANVYLVTMGGLTGTAPILEHGGETAGVTDPLVQALVLTAIVIGFGTTAFALVLTYRLYQEHGTMDLRDVAGDLRPDQASASGAESDVATGSGIVGDDGRDGDEPATDGGVDTAPGSRARGRGDDGTTAERRPPGCSGDGTVRTGDDGAAEGDRDGARGLDPGPDSGGCDRG